MSAEDWEHILCAIFNESLATRSGIATAEIALYWCVSFFTHRREMRYPVGSENPGCTQRWEVEVVIRWGGAFRSVLGGGYFGRLVRWA